MRNNVPILTSIRVYVGGNNLLSFCIWPLHLITLSPLLNMEYTSNQLRRLYLRGIINVEYYHTLIQNRKSTIQRGFRKMKTFSIDSISDTECDKLFRFNKNELMRLYNGLGIPKICTLSNGIKFSGFEGMLILLRRLCYPNRLLI